MKSPKPLIQIALMLSLGALLVYLYLWFFQHKAPDLVEIGILAIFIVLMSLALYSKPDVGPPNG